jgi:hypothetical protein
VNGASIAWAPLLPVPVLAGLAVLSALVLAVALLRKPYGRAPAGFVLRCAGILMLLVALGNPSAVIEDRQALRDIAVVVVDDSASQQIGQRRARADAALAALGDALAGRDDIDMLTVRVGPGDAAATAGRTPSEGTRLFGALQRALADVPRERLAGAVFVTDGQIHDAPENPANLALGAPLHTLLTGERDEGDRRLTIVQSPGYGIVGQPIGVTIRIDEPAEGRARQAQMTIRRNGEAQSETILVPVGVDHTIDLDVDRGGPGVFELSVAAGARELTLANNNAVIVVNGVRDRLRVLLVSGEPHPGERTWRNLLKADPSVDLVHFTILRPPEKQDGTPVRELSLIAFPIRELFEIKLDEFDLIIFDRYQRRGVLPSLYLGNIARYVEEGGALLEAGGPGFASANSLYRTPLSTVLPGAPTGEVMLEPFRATITDTGQRHPVTASLPGGNRPNAEGRASRPGWGRWFRQVEATTNGGEVLMDGVPGRPLLILDHVGEGRVAQLMSDQIWLWARNYEGGGPHAELLRRLAHWLMKEPELEEDLLAGEVQGGELRIVRRSLKPDDTPVTVTFPSGRTETVALAESGGGRAEGVLAVDEAGLYRLADGERTAIAAVGALNPLEFSDVVTTDAIVRPVAEATGGGIVWLADGGAPPIRRVEAGRDMAGTAAGGADWIGLQTNRQYDVRGVTELPLLPGLALLLLALAALLFAWQREGR